MVSKVLKGLTLADVAKWTGIPYPTLQAYRLGKRTPPPATIKKIARALEARAGELNDLARTLESALKEQ